jgi:hypothetical protein
MPIKTKITHVIKNLSKMTKAKSKFLLEKASSNMLPKCMNLKENPMEISLPCLITTLTNQEIEKSKNKNFQSYKVSSRKQNSHIYN